ncbi:hypothetical protein OPQ81_004284 [Rhizoctonia solani]|nr:hypothetical protein OPQ81_004284 [Rhizoctonia solani]
MIMLNKLWINIFPTERKVEEASLERVSGDTVRLTVRRSFRWTSGQHAYILAPTIAKLPFEAHPFTIASVYSKEAHKDGRMQELVFIIRGRNGFTKRLLETSETRQSIPVIIDGPYGAPPRLSHYSTCIFLAGGSGVSYTLPLLLDLLRQVKSGEGVAQRILFVWVVRDASHINWIGTLLQEALQGYPPTLQLTINIHVTQQNLSELLRVNMKTEETMPVESKQSLAEKSTSSLLSPHVVKVLGGRPDIGAILEEELSCACGRASIDVSGPSALADAARDALVKCKEAQPAAVLGGVPRTTLHVEVSCQKHDGIYPVH